MADISKITVLDGTSYDIKDATAREELETLSVSLYWQYNSTTDTVDLIFPSAT